MKEIDIALKGVTHHAKNGEYDQLLVTMMMSSCVMNSEGGAKWDFPFPPLVTALIEPYRLVIPLNDKYTLTRNGSEVELRATGPADNPKVTLVRVLERKDVALKDFLPSLIIKEPADEIDVTLKGVTHRAKNGEYDQLLLTMSLKSCVVNSEGGAEWNFPMPPFVTALIEPYRMVIPLNDKYALTRIGSEVELRATGRPDNPKVTLVRVLERKEIALKDFLPSLSVQE